MNWADLIKRTERLFTSNSPHILTAIGVSGTLATAFLTGKASFQACNTIRHEELYEENRTMEPKERFLVVWKLYIPAASTGVLTVVCIIAANRIGARRAAAIAAVYSISERAFVEYKEKVVETLGVNKEQALRDGLAQDRVTRDPVHDREVIITGNGEVLCHEAFTGRYFNCSMETLKKAQNDMNYQILNGMYASLSDFYEKIGLPLTSFSDEIGWTTDRSLELKFSATLSGDQRPCISFEYHVSPKSIHHQGG